MRAIFSESARPWANANALVQWTSALWIFESRKIHLQTVWHRETGARCVQMVQAWDGHITSLILDIWPITIWFTNLFLCHKRWKYRMHTQQWTRNGRKSKRFQRGNNRKSRVKKRLFSKHRETKKKVHFATLIDIRHLKNAELEPKLQKIQKQSGAPWLHCKIRLWSLCSFYCARLVCVPNDCRKSNGCDCKITRLWRTNSWCSIRVHSRKVGGRSQIAQNFKVRMSRRIDTSSTTQVAEIMVKHWRSNGTSWTKFVRTPACWSLVGKTVRSSSIGTWVGKKYRIGNVFAHRKQGLLLSVYVDDIKMAGQVLLFARNPTSGARIGQVQRLVPFERQLRDVRAGR